MGVVTTMMVQVRTCNVMGEPALTILRPCTSAPELDFINYTCVWQVDMYSTIKAQWFFFTLLTTKGYVHPCILSGSPQPECFLALSWSGYKGDKVSLSLVEIVTAPGAVGCHMRLRTYLRWSPSPLLSLSKKCTPRWTSLNHWPVFHLWHLAWQLLPQLEQSLLTVQHSKGEFMSIST